MSVGSLLVDSLSVVLAASVVSGSAGSLCLNSPVFFWLAWPVPVL